MALALATFGTAARAEPGVCDAAERVIWSCKAGRKVYALCASQDLSESAGYLQYRVQQAGETALLFPTPRRHPKGLFELGSLARGASLTFQNRGYTYTIAEPLAGPTTIEVLKNDKLLAEVRCQQASDTLTLTDVQALFKRVGIYR